MALQIVSASQIAKRFALDTADGLRSSASTAVDTAVRLLSQLEEAGADKGDLAMLRGVMLDTLSTIQGRIDRGLDAEGLVTEHHQIDISELRP